ncbi:hypothetical protein chiPu_0033314, partial [Chiloscyllium punctatum]|nr:hypothetical protein [Chiloscyllium punctatum]
SRVQPARGRAVPRQAPHRRLLRRVEGQVRRQGLGAAREVRRQTVLIVKREARQREICYGSCRDDAGRGRRGGVTAPSPPLCSRCHRCGAGMAGRNPGGDPCRRRGRHPVRGRGGALRAAHAADLVRRAGVDPVPVACDVGISGRAPPRRAHAHDGLGGKRRTAALGLSRRRRDLRRAG